MNAHVTSYYLDKYRRAGGTFDVRVNNTWETGCRLQSVSIDDAATCKMKLHEHGHLSVSICRAGTFDPVAIY